ncbi:unnamed protein product [Adineta ricciae]|uniref:Uncharacterized protein n=1 Tax=Adineta ricciae TaxID=249248 RepID=A0A815P1P0_ADIRI|nr:unnamed protein product [Adineta ricciae]CAF1442047.1 unnamed protein product [Adineta ricciae]
MVTSIMDDNINTSSVKDKKYHIILIYLVHEEDNNYCGGGYRDVPTKLVGAVGGDTINDMVDEAYESLEENVRTEINVPFNTENIKESVAFDLVECYNEEEMNVAFEYRRQGRSCEDINMFIAKLRDDEKNKHENRG